MPAEVGLTGATGTLGRRIVPALAERGLTAAAFQGDICEPGSVGRWIDDGDFSVIIHCAAVVPVTKVEADLPRAIAVNVGGTAAVAVAARDAGKRLVQVSTSHVYAPSEQPVSENAELAPSTHYGLTKLQGEMWCMRLVPDSLIVRVFSYFDTEQPSSFVVPAMSDRISVAAHGSELEVFGFDSVRDMASAQWLASRIVDLALSATAGVVNLGTGKGVAIGELARRMATLAGRSDLTFVPAVQEPSNALVADTTRLAALLPGGVPQFDLDAALREFIDA